VAHETTDNESPCWIEHGPCSGKDKEHDGCTGRLECSNCNRGQSLAPIPYRRAARVKLLQQVAGKCLVMRSKSQMLQHPASERNGFGCPHARSPPIDGSTFQSLVRTRRVSCTERRPSAVTRKYRLALPPRSGLDSPRLDVMSPFSSSRSNAA
jgi:hypothetical protein